MHFHLRRLFLRILGILLLAAMCGLFAQPREAASAPTLNTQRLVQRPVQMPLATAGMASLYSVEEKVVYLLGGYRNTGAGKELAREILRYDPFLDRIVQVDQMPIGLALSASVYIPALDRIYFFGGLTDEGGTLAASAKIWSYDLFAREWTELPHTLPSPRMRGDAVYNPQTHEIYIVGGQDREDFSDATFRNEILRYRIDDGSISATTLPKVGPGFNAVWTHVEFFPLPFSARQTTSDDPRFELPVGVQTGMNRSHLFIYETHGYVVLDPADFSVLLEQTEFDAGGRVGAGVDWVPSEQVLWSVGGYDPAEPPCHIHKAELHDPWRRSRSTIAEVTPETLGTHDVAAVYVADLDRLFVFGGLTPPRKVTGDCEPFLTDPEPGQISSAIYTLTPDRPGGVVSEIGNRAAGSDTELVIERASAGFSVAIQAAFQQADGNSFFQTRILTPKAQSRTADTDRVTVTLPDDLYPGADERVVSFCVIEESRPLSNCREVAITLNPGGLRGTILRDMTPIGGGGNEPVSDVVLELIDEDGMVVKRTTTGADGIYDFCANESGDTCLGLGEYTLNVQRPWQASDIFQSEPFFHKTTSPATIIQAGQVGVQDFVLPTTRKLVGTVTSFYAEYDKLAAGDQVGTFYTFHAFPGLKVDPVNNKFIVHVSESFARAERVEFTLNGTTVTDSNRENGWSAKMDMTALLQDGDNTLSIITYHTREGKDFESEPHLVTIKATPYPKNLASDVVTLPDGVRWLKGEEMYRVWVATPAGLVWPQDEPSYKLDFDVIVLHNRAQYGANLYEKVDLAGKWSARGDIGLFVTLLGFKPNDYLIDKPVGEISTVYGPDHRSIDSYDVLSIPLDVCRVLRQAEFAAGPKPEDKEEKKKKTDYCDSWIPTPFAIGYKKTLLDVPVEATLGLLFKFGGEIYLAGSLDGQTWVVDDKLQLIPVPRLTLLAGMVATADFVVATGEVGIGLEGTVRGGFPIAYEPDASPPVYPESPCFAFTVDATAWASYETLTSQKTKKVSHSLFDERLPKKCSIPSVKTRSITETLNPPEVMPAPAVAIAEDGGVMQVWLEDANPQVDALDLVLRYQYQGSTAESGPIYDGGDMADPAVAFLGPDRAIAVWTDVRPEASRAIQAETLADLVPLQELYASVWNRGAGWSAPEQLTNNAVGDGLPQLATHPDNGQLLLVWNRDSDGNPATRGDWQLVSRLFRANVWEAEQVVIDQGTTAELSPALAWHPSGSQAWLVWIRQQEVDTHGFGRNDLRRMAYATWNGTAWSAPTEPAEWPTGALHPSIAFKPSGYPTPLVAMVVPPAPDEPGRQAGAFSANNRIHTAWVKAGVWTVQSVADARGAQPQATFYTDNHPLIILRGFGGGEDDGPTSTGQVAVAAGKINGVNELRWAPPGILTGDDETIWQIGGVTLPANGQVANGMVTFVGVKDSFPTRSQLQSRGTQSWARGAAARVVTRNGVHAKALGGTDQTGIFGISDDMDGYDPEVERISVSNPLPNPGELVTVTVVIRNTELRPLGSTGDPAFEINLCVDGRECPFSGDDGFATGYNGNLRRYPLDNRLLPPDPFGDVELLFNEPVSVPLTYVSSGSPEKLRVHIQRNANDLDGSNNTLEFNVGVAAEQPPLQAATAKQADGRIQVTWSEPLSLTTVSRTGAPLASFYRVYRASSAEGPWNLVGLSSHERLYLDSSPGESAHYYRIALGDLHGRSSTPGTPVATAGGPAPQLAFEAPSTDQFSVYLPQIKR